MNTSTETETHSDREVLEALAAPIDPSEVKSRAGDNGKQYRYIDASTCRQRLDLVVGPENWETRLQAVPAGPEQAPGFLCVLTVHLPSGKAVARTGCGSCPSPVQRDGKVKADGLENSTKSGATDALKRACVEFGIGAELYDDDPAPPARDNRRPATNGQSARPHQQPLETPHNLVGWLKDREKSDSEARGIFDAVVKYGQQYRFPRYMREWDAAQRAEGYEEALRYLGELSPRR